MKKRISDVIADFLESKGIRHVFGIVGAGNAHIFDAITRKNFTEIVCVHHEQAACMAMQAYYRTNGIVTASIVTTGAGSTNAVTGVVSAWMDSIPCLVISGNENSKFTRDDNPLRIWGVQGYDSTAMVSKVTKFSERVNDPKYTLHLLDKAYNIAQSGRPGPCWLDIPMNIQATEIDTNELKEPAQDTRAALLYSGNIKNATDGANEVMTLLGNAKRPVIWLGHGIRLANAIDLIEPFINLAQIPVIVSWAGIDMIATDHPLVFGRAGVYGQRSANFILQNCDFLLTIGTRLAIPQIGYDISELAREAKIAVVDIDSNEVTKHAKRVSLPILADAKDFLTKAINLLQGDAGQSSRYQHWLSQCETYRHKYPVPGPEHNDKDGYINSYPFMQRLSEHFKENQIIVTDMGTALLSGHQALNIKDGQRLMTSTGLGEMGYGLPGAIGASFATDKGEVICLNCDGGMMLNLQELQTVVHHQLPIKLFIFNNDGYLMIKHTQKALFSGRYAGTNQTSGVSCPNFGKLADAFNIPSFSIKTWSDFDKIIPDAMSTQGPVICEVFTHPEQMFVPKLSLAPQKDGSIISPPLEDLSPLLPREELKQNMLIGIHKKSECILD